MYVLNGKIKYEREGERENGWRAKSLEARVFRGTASEESFSNVTL